MLVNNTGIMPCLHSSRWHQPVPNPTAPTTRVCSLSVSGAVRGHRKRRMEAVPVVYPCAEHDRRLSEHHGYCCQYR